MPGPGVANLLCTDHAGLYSVVPMFFIMGDLKLVHVCTPRLIFPSSSYYPGPGFLFSVIFLKRRPVFILDAFEF